ncbi:protein AMBP isoform X2 [Girardinichthys multiradiatus]|uniref:protein AMBP isoform X2 n=1 Tax=Girardinichthys multiradiatus TaxID=208333 RepID=UPI001FAE53B4|nr:protein AMBP isoform X2 [Girardinichthys multiradiatus]
MFEGFTAHAEERWCHCVAHLKDKVQDKWTQSSDKMQKSVILVSLLVLGWMWTPQGLPVLPDPLYSTQENFDLSKFLGTWHDVAKASTCPYMQRHRGDLAIGKLVLQKSTTEGKLKMTRTALRMGTCKERTGDYELTSTPGRFFYHVAKWGADVDAYVVHTNYNEYAIMIMSKQKSTGDRSISLKLYSRTKTVRPTVLEDFKVLVRQQGMGDNTIFIKKDKGDCVPGEQVAAPTTQSEPQRVRRNVVPSLVPEDTEGSGDDTTLFNGTKACNAAPDTGPCFGIHNRFFYNSSSMSCELFKYGGCLGNQNNFKTERECLQRCRTEAVCRLPMAAQPCTGQPTIWAFDPSTGLCVHYKPGFCQSNANKFYTKSECEEYCGVVKDDDLLMSN